MRSGLYEEKQIKKALCNLIQNALFLYPKFLLRQPYSRETDFVLFVQNGAVVEHIVILY